MATQIFSSIPDLSTDAAFRAWGSAISTALQALFTKVTQTGEIDWSTVSKPAGANTSAGFEVYRFGDSLQATVPVFFKIEYGAGGATSYPALWATVGKGADGSGNITSGLLSRTRIIGSLGSPAATAKNSYIGSGDGSCLVMSMWPTDAAMQNGSGSVFVLERSRDTSGNATGAALFWEYGSSASAFHTVEAVDYTAATENTTTFGSVPIPYACASGVSLSNGVNTPIFTGMVMTPARVSWVPTSIVGCARAEFGIGVVASSLVNGIDYLALGAATPYADMSKQEFAASMIRWS